MTDLLLVDQHEEPDIVDPLFDEFELDDPGDIPPDEGDAGEKSLKKVTIATPAQIEAVAASRHINPSGLSAAHRIKARDLTMQAMALVLAHKSSVHYSQGASRWSGINNHDRAWKGQYPTECDCSATDTWALWCGLTHFARFVHVDIVNGAKWRAGFTGTMTKHGRSVLHMTLQRADQVFYGGTRSIPEHVATYIGGGLVISHGSEPGPFKLSMHYRRDIVDIRRYI